VPVWKFMFLSLRFGLKQWWRAKKLVRTRVMASMKTHRTSLASTTKVLLWLIQFIC